MSTKDYVAIGDILRKFNTVLYKPLFRELLDELSEVFQKDNKRFNKKLFVEYATFQEVEEADGWKSLSGSSSQPLVV
jgi:hypothetical protein